MLQISCIGFFALLATTLGDYQLPYKFVEYAPAYTYEVPQKHEVVYETPNKPSVPFSSYEAPHHPSDVYGVPEVPKKPTPVYGVPEVPKQPTPVYGVPEVPKKPTPVYGVPVVPKKPVAVYGVPEEYKPHPTVNKVPYKPAHVYGVPVPYEVPKVHKPIVSHYKYALPEHHLYNPHPVEAPVYYYYYPKPAEVYGVPQF